MFFIILRLENESFTGFNLRYAQTRFRDIVQTKSYTFEGLVGNVGGYIGLFLGCAIVQLPNLLMTMFRKIKKTVTDRRDHKIGLDITVVELSSVEC